MSSHIAAIVPTLMAGWLMVVAGLGKKRLERRARICPRCRHRSCVCGSRR
jgi:hypothetical protein